MVPEYLLVQTDAAPLKSKSLCQFIPAEDLVYGLGNKRERGGGKTDPATFCS